MFRRKLWSIAALSLITLVGLAALCLQRATAGPLDLNQHFIEDHWLEAGSFEGREALKVRWARLRTGFAQLLPSGKGTDGVDLGQPRTVFSYVFSHLPARAVVYPTETYYYWKFPLRERTVSGNLRLLDAHRGVLHIGYFDPEDSRVLGAATFGARDGLTIEPASAQEFRVTYEGRTVTFFLPGRALKAPADLRLLPGEKLVSGVLDESGLALVLLFHQGQNAFYFILNDLFPVADRLVPVEGSDGAYLIGQRSRFVFFRDQDHGRRLLVGVAAQNIRLNNFYDGPFDQVPPRLALRSMLEAAYPYVRLAGGIDQHGNFLTLEGQRVAISPYQAYEGLTDLVAFLGAERARKLTGPALWARMTYESKRDFHKQQAAPGTLPSLYGGEHMIFRSQGWPANHWGQNSRAWPLDHIQPVSSRWPPNHNTGTSRGGQKTAPAPEAEGHRASVSRQMIRSLRKTSPPPPASP